MPIYEYIARDPKKGCKHCLPGFEILQRISDEPLVKCPRCWSPLKKLISSPSVGHSRSGLDHRAKSAGFTKMKKTADGGYEKMY